jgi:hypothetical protein
VEPITSSKASKSPKKHTQAKNSQFKPWANSSTKSAGKEIASVQRKGIFGQGKTSKAFGGDVAATAGSQMFPAKKAANTESLTRDYRKSTAR